MRKLFLSAYPPQGVEDQPTGSIAWFLTTFSIVLGFILLSALLIAGSSFQLKWNSPNFLTFLGLCLLIGATGFAFGGFIGFLFGVPRVKSSPEGEASGIASNTNLEQVSDWLTKIIVGVTLVQFDRVNDALIAFGAMVDRGLKIPAHGGGTAVVAGAGLAANLVLVGSAVAGFLAAYLKSKTDLMEAFAPRQQLQSNLGKAIAEQVIGDAGRQVLDRPSLQPDQCAKDMAAKLIQFVHPGTQDGELHRLLGLAQAILKNFRASADALARAVALNAATKQGADPALIVLATRALAIAGQREAARAMSSMPVSTDSSVDAAESEIARMFACLYARGGYEESIQIGERLAKDQRTGKSSRLWLYLAAAYGQAHAALLQSDPTNADAIHAARQSALDAAKRAIQLDRTHNLPTLRMLWDASDQAKPPEENDLESLYHDTDFEALFRRDEKRTDN